MKEFDVPSRRDANGANLSPASAVFGIDPNHSPIDNYMAVRTNQGVNPTYYIINTTLTGAAGVQFLGATAGKITQLLGVTIDVTHSATAGNRQLYAWILSPTGATMWVGALSAIATANQITGYDIGFGNPLGTPSTTVRRTIAGTANTNIQVRESTALSWFAVGAGVSIKDINNTDPADVVATRFVTLEYPL